MLIGVATAGRRIRRFGGVIAALDPPHHLLADMLRQLGRAPDTTITAFTDGPPAGDLDGKPPAEPCTSTTDPEARAMKMADGGFRPAFTVQYVTDTASQLIAAVALGNIGSDQGQVGQWSSSWLSATVAA